VIDRDGENLTQLEADVTGCIFWGADSDSVFIRGFDVYGGPSFYIDFNAVNGTWASTIRLTDSWEAASMAVSPDRTRVAFHTVITHDVTQSGGAPQFEYEYPSKVVIVRAPGGERLELAIPDAILVRETMIAWSPDGAALYVTGWCLDDDNTSALWRMPVNGDSPERLTDCVEGWLRRPTVSPDGGRIAFEADWGGTPTIYVLDIGIGARWRVDAND
jgi:Tol biopolymer transport system component